MAPLPARSGAYDGLTEAAYDERADRLCAPHARRHNGDHFLVAPPMITTEAQVDEIMDKLTATLDRFAAEARAGPRRWRRSSSPAPSPARSTRPPCRRICPGGREDIADQAVEAAEAGAAILHLHARDPDRPAARRPIPIISWRSCPISPRAATRWSEPVHRRQRDMPLDERLAGPLRAAARDVLAQHGNDEFRALSDGGALPTGSSTGKSRFCANSDDLVFKNTPRDIAHVLAEMGGERGARFEFECYDSGHLTCCGISRSRAGEAAVVPAVRLRRAGRHGGGARKPDPHEAAGGPVFRRGLHVLGAGRGAGADADGQPWRRRWAGMCGSGWRTTFISPAACWPARTPSRCAHPRDRRGAGAPRRHARRGARDAGAEGRGQGGVLMGGIAIGVAGPGDMADLHAARRIWPGSLAGRAHHGRGADGGLHRPFGGRMRRDRARERRRGGRGHPVARLLQLAGLRGRLCQRSVGRAGGARHRAWPPPARRLRRRRRAAVARALSAARRS
jgi:hypothetical protein